MTTLLTDHITWHHDQHPRSHSKSTVENDPTIDSSAPLPAPAGPRSIGAQLLRQRMFPNETPASKIGRYLVLDLLGQGGMGQVFAAYDPVLDRKVAIKLINGLGGPTQRIRLLREAQALARLSHPNVVQVYEAGEHEQQVFVAMQFVDGQTLREWVVGPEGQRPSSREILDKFRQAGLGLAAAHAAGLVHRDFTPNNVLVDHDGAARVLDFGLVVGIGDSEPSPSDGDPKPLDVELTTTGTMLGTPGYMAPEQWSGERVDARSDQFGFCVALHEALTGARPFAGRSVTELARNIAEGVRARPDALRSLPRRVTRALDRGLSQNPADRWPSMPALLDAITPPSRARIAAIASAVVIPALAVGVWQLVDRYETKLDVGAEQLAAQAEQTESQTARAEQLERNNRAARIAELARAPGREREAIALAVDYMRDPDEPNSASATLASQTLVDLVSGYVPVAELDGPARSSVAATFSADGERLVTTPVAVSGEQTLEVWAPASARRVAAIALGELDIGDAPPSISADGSHVAVGTAKRCAAFDVDTGASVLELDDCVQPLFSTDGKIVFGEIPCADQGQVVGRTLTCAIAAWSLADGAQVWEHPLIGREASVEVHPNGQWLVVGHDGAANQAVELVRTADGTREALIELPGAGKGVQVPVFDQHFSLARDGSAVATLVHRGDNLGVSQIVVVDLVTRTSKALNIDDPGWGWPWSESAIAADGSSVLVFARRGGGLVAHDVAEDRPIYVQDFGESVGAPTPKGWLVISDGQWLELPTPRARQAAPLTERLVVSGDGRFAVTLAPGGSKLWDLDTRLGELGWTAPEGHATEGFTDTQVVSVEVRGGREYVHDRSGVPSRVAVSDSRRVIARATERPTRGIVETRAGLEVLELGQPTSCRLPKGTRLPRLSRDGRFAAGIVDDELVIWTIDGCERMRTIDQPFAQLMNIDVRNDGSVLVRNDKGRNALIQVDGTTHLVDEGCSNVDPGSLGPPPSGPYVGWSTLSPDHRLLLTSCDATAPERQPWRLWNVESGALVRELDGREYDRVFGMFSDDGEHLLFQARDRIVVVDVADGHERLRLPGELPQARGSDKSRLARTRGDVLEYPGAGGIVSLPLTIDGVVDLACELLSHSQPTGARVDSAACSGADTTARSSD